jgi:hypothetical protein
MPFLPTASSGASWHDFVKANPSATAIPHPGYLDAHRTNPGLHLALPQVAIPDHCLAALGIVAVGILSEKQRL